VGVGVSVTLVPAAKSAKQVPVVPLPVTVQLMPDGDDVTVPVPLPVAVTVSATGSRVNAVFTLRSWLMVSEHVSVPVQSPVQPLNRQPLAGVAVRVTAAPNEYVAAQLPVAVPSVRVHEMPAGFEAIVPDPEPLTETTGLFMSNRALTVAAAETATVHVPVPEQAPLQPTKRLPAEGLAVKVTDAPALKLPAHVPDVDPVVMVHDTPDGLDVTVPDPVPVPVTLTANVFRTNCAVTPVPG
jgi:hypothetical protein